MDAVSFLLKHASVEQIMEHYKFRELREDGDYIRSCCEIHRGDNPSSFVVNRDTSLWFCHTECGGGDMFTLVQKMEGVAFPQAVNRVAEICGISIIDMQITERKEGYMRELKEFMRIIKQMSIKPEHAPYDLPSDTKRITKLRSFMRETLEHYDVRFVDSMPLISKKGTSYHARKRILVPISLNGITIGASMRATQEGDIPKWLHVPVGISTGDLLYNLDEYSGEELIVIVEGIYDAWAFREIGVWACCTFGAHLSHAQYQQIIRLGVDVCLAYDGDEAGRKATEKACNALRGKARVFTVDFAEGEDPEKISRDELKEKYVKRRRLA